METPLWSSLLPGVWRFQVGEPEQLTPLSLLNFPPRTEALETLGKIGFPPSLATPEVERVGRQTVLRLPITPDESLHGLGLQFFKVNHRGRTRYLRVNSDPRQDTGESHAPVPFLVSSQNYGILVNTARIVTFCCGSVVRKGAPTNPLLDRGRDSDWQATPLSHCLEIVVGSPDFEVIVFAGNSLLEVVQRYNLYTGGGTLPPRWGLGFWHRVHFQHTDRQALEEALEFRERGYPCDVIGLEPGWQTNSYPCTFEWGADRFPDPAKFVREMGDNGFKVNLWEHGYIHPSARTYPKLEPLSGSHTVWGGIAPDFTLTEAQEILKEQHDTDHVQVGVSGYKLDECDGSELTGASWMFPAHTTFPSGADGEQMRQVYGLALQKITFDLFKARNRRTYGLVRASNAGASPLPSVLYSDLYDHREFIRALVNSGYSGLLWTPEVRNADSAEDWVRRMQTVCFSAMAKLNAWWDGTKPWSFPEVEPIILKCLRLRMRLMPYLYSAFAKYYFEGIPPIRALTLSKTPAANPEEVSRLANEEYAWYLGDSLLVAPLFAGETWRDLYLPTGDWFDFETGEHFAGGTTHRLYPGLDKIPVFVRNGGIIPLQPECDHAPSAGIAVPLEVRHYGDAPGRFALYDDDGETFDFERGAYRWHNLEVSVAADGSRSGNTLTAEPGWQSAYESVTWKFMG